MKIWKGPEMEGKDKDEMTMFVQGTVLDQNRVITTLKENPDCKRLYLGAGRVNMISTFGVSKGEVEPLGIVKLVRYCKATEIKIIVETSLQGFDYIPDVLFDESDQIIVRILDNRLNGLRETDYIKIDTKKAVHIAEIQDMVSTDLISLNKHLQFNVDTVLYEDKDEEG